MIKHIDLFDTNLPICIKESELYKTLIEEFNNENSIVEFDEKLCYFDTNIKNINDVIKWIPVYCYWQMQELPNEIYTYILNCLDKSELKNTIDHFIHFPELQWLIRENITLDTMNEKHKVTCFEKGYIRLLPFIELNKLNLEYSYKAASKGHLDCLRYAHEQGCTWDKNTCYRAAENGHLDCLRYAHKNGCPWDKETCEYAALKGHLECLQYAHENGCPWDESVCAFAAQYCHLYP